MVIEKERIIGLIGILIIVVAFSGCISPDNQDMGDIETKNYNQNGISFDYPSTWSLEDKYSAPYQVVMLSRNERPWSLLRVFVNENIVFSQEQLKTSARRDAISQDDIITDEYYASIDGERGYYVHSYKNSKEGRDEAVSIYYVKNNKSYVLRFSTQSYETVESEIDTIINSFHAY